MKRISNHHREGRASPEPVPGSPDQELPGPNPTEKRFLKALHWMHCPKCGYELTPERRAEIDVDVCPNCRGIWLDAADLDTMAQSEGGFDHSSLRSIAPAPRETQPQGP